MVKIKLNTSIQLDGVIYGKGETVEVSDNMFNTLITDNVDIEAVKEEQEYKRKKIKSEDDV